MDWDHISPHMGKRWEKNKHPGHFRKIIYLGYANGFLYSDAKWKCALHSITSFTHKYFRSDFRSK